jgi:cyanophycinase
MKRLAMLSAASFLAATMMTPAHATPPVPAKPPRGTMIMIGGALSDGNSEIYQEIVRRAGGPRARIGVITAASIPPSQDPAAGTSKAANSATNGRFYAGILERYGAGAAQWLPIDLDHPGAADDPKVAGQVASMTGFVFGGGDQYRLVTALLHGTAHTDSRVLSAIRARFAQGAVVVGTSAGAQIQSGRDMVTGGASYQALRDGSRAGYFDDDTLLADLPAGGFGLFADGLVDTHFSANGRLGRAVRLAADTGHQRVFGLDPDTALEVTGTSLRVLGRHGVSVLDLREATPGVRGGHWSIGGVRWTYLTRGAVYDPATWTCRMPPGTPRLTPADRAAASVVEDIFDSAANDRKGFRLTHAALDLAGAGRSATLLGQTYETNPVFTVALRKGDTFTAWGNGAATAFANLTVSMYSSPRQP